MSGGATAAWIAAGAAAAGTAVSIDQANNARHQARLQAEEQQRQLEEAARMNEENLRAQQSMQDQQLELQASLAAESQAQMDKQLKSADEAMNRSNQNKPDARRVLAEAQQNGRTGNSGTMLTGATGVDPNALVLGKNTLLGA